MTIDNQDLVKLINQLDKKERDTAIFVGVEKGLLKSREYKNIHNSKSILIHLTREVRYSLGELKEKYPNPHLGIRDLEIQEHYYEAALLCEITDKKGFDRKAMKYYSMSGDYKSAFSKAQKANDAGKTKIYQSLDNILGSNL